MRHSLSKDTAFNGETTPRHIFLCSDSQCLPPGDPRILCAKHGSPITGKSFIDSSKTSLLDEMLVSLLLMLSGMFFSNAGGGGGVVGLYRDDGLAVCKATPKEIEKTKKEVCDVFKSKDLKIQSMSTKKSFTFLMSPSTLQTEVTSHT